MNHINQASDYVYEKLIYWFNDFNVHEVTNLVTLVEKSEGLVRAAESIPEEKLQQFIDNFTYDLHDFYRQYKSEYKHSLYVKLLQESFWHTLADITDKSQVEWYELHEDIAHKGEYRAGDTIGFGLLVCAQCEHDLTITHLTVVSACSHCGGKYFHRKMLNA